MFSNRVISTPSLQTEKMQSSTAWDEKQLQKIASDKEHQFVVTYSICEFVRMAKKLKVHVGSRGGVGDGVYRQVTRSVMRCGVMR